MDQLRKFLDDKHGDQWSIWEFRAEGTGYPDSEMYNRVFHYPWPDHHPPPFALIPFIMASMRNWLQDPSLSEEQKKKRVIVVHCKAGKGRSGTASCSYLISEEGWSKEDALKRFTERRMRPNFGAGVSIPSQLRYVGYVERWARNGKFYVERPVQVLEVHIWGLRNGVKVAVEGFVDEGRTIKVFHVFQKEEREIVRGHIQRTSTLADVVSEAMKGNIGNNNNNNNTTNKSVGTAASNPSDEKALNETNKTNARVNSDLRDDQSGDVVFRPKEPITLPTSDLNIDFERRNQAGYGMSMVTAVAHVWFNTFFEGQGPEREGDAHQSGVFEIDWDAMDGIKGSLRKGTRAFDKMAVVWRTAPETKSRKTSTVISEPALGEEVKEAEPADWRGVEAPTPGGSQKVLGLRAETPHSRDVSRASSVRSRKTDEDAGSDTEGVKSFGVSDEERKRRKDEEKRQSALLPTSKDLPGPTHPVAAGDDVDGIVLKD